MIIYQINDNYDDYVEINGIKVPRELKFPNGNFVSCTIIENKAVYKGNDTQIVFDNSVFEISLLLKDISFTTYIKKDTKIITPKQMLFLFIFVSGSSDDSIKKITDPKSRLLVNLTDGSIVININNNLETVLLTDIDSIVICDIDGNQLLCVNSDEKKHIFSLNGKNDLNPVIPLIKSKNYEALKEFFDNKCVFHHLMDEKIILDNHSFKHNNQLFVVNVYSNGTYYPTIELASDNHNVYYIHFFVDTNNRIRGTINQDVNITDMPNDITKEQLIQWIDLYENNKNKQSNAGIKNAFDVIVIIFKFIFKSILQILTYLFIDRVLPYILPKNAV